MLGKAFEQVGGETTFKRLVEVFYDLVAKDPDLSPMFPEDFTLIKDKQYRFLSQFFGGPPLYTQKYGHPMLRARHLPFPIEPRHAEAWLRCMSQAMDEVGLTGELREDMFRRLKLTAIHMINTIPEEDQTGARPAEHFVQNS